MHIGRNIHTTDIVKSMLFIASNTAKVMKIILPQKLNHYKLTMTIMNDQRFQSCFLGEKIHVTQLLESHQCIQ